MPYKTLNTTTQSAGASDSEVRDVQKSKAFGFLFLGVFFWSLMPLVVAVSGAGDRPFLFASLFGLFSAIGLILYLAVFKPARAKDDDALREDSEPTSVAVEAKSAKATEDVTLAKLWGEFKVQLLPKSRAASTSYMAVQDGEKRETGRVASQSWVYLGLAAIGLLFVNVAQNGTVSSLAFQGFVLAAISSILAALQIYSPLRYGEIAADRRLAKTNSSEEASSAEPQLSFWDRNALLLTFLGRFEVLLFAWSTQFIDTAVATMIYELWVIWFVFFRSRSVRNTAATATTAEEDNGNTTDKKPTKDPKGDIALAHTLFVIIIMTLLSSAINFAIFLGRLLNDSSKFDYTGSQLAWVIIGGIVIGSTVFIFNRKGNHLAREAPDLNAIAYATPVLAIIWLLAWNRIDIARFDMFIIGAALIVSVNLMINFKADLNRVGFQWLVVSIWIAGVAIYFRDWVGSYADIVWLWEHEIVDYYTIVALSVTVFTLILSFRSSRLVARTKDEEELAFSLYRHLETFGEKVAAASVAGIDRSQSLADLKEHHNTVAEAIHNSTTLVPTEKARLLSDLDSLATSKTRNRDLSEPIVLIIFAFIAVSLTVFTRPLVDNAAEEWIGFLLESFSVLFSATIIFLTVNLFDNMSERKMSSFALFHAENTHLQQTDSNAGGTGLIVSQTLQRSISSVLVAGMIALFGLLLWSKWLGATWLVEADLFGSLG